MVDKQQLAAMGEHMQEMEECKPEFKVPDGWIEWKGGECPVDHGVMIDVRYRDGAVRKCMPALEPVADYHDVMHQYWQNDGVDGDIIAYLLHKPEQSKPEFCESVMRSIPEPEAKPTIEQLASYYRNKLDYANRKQDEANKANMESDAALSQLEDAIAKIGFAITPLAATEKESELVITDWRGLQVGDVIKCVGDSWRDHFQDSEAVVEWLEGHDYEYDLRIHARIGYRTD